MVLEKTFESPLDSKAIQRKSVNPKEINSEYSLEGLILKLKVQYFGHLMQRVNSLEKTMMLGKIEGKRRKGQQKMRCLDSFIDSVDMSLSKLRESVKDREICSPWGLQRFGHDLAAEPQQHLCSFFCLLFLSSGQFLFWP